MLSPRSATWPWTSPCASIYISETEVWLSPSSPGGSCDPTWATVWNVVWKLWGAIWLSVRLWAYTCAITQPVHTISPQASNHHCLRDTQQLPCSHCFIYSLHDSVSEVLYDAHFAHDKRGSLRSKPRSRDLETTGQDLNPGVGLPLQSHDLVCSTPSLGQDLKSCLLSAVVSFQKQKSKWKSFINQAEFLHNMNNLQKKR